MTGQTNPVKHEVVFTLSEQGKARATALLARCGHNNMSLLIARGLALVEWVEDQADLGRSVAGVMYGEGEDGEPLIAELQERSELLKPLPRLQSVPVKESEPVTPTSAPAAQVEPAPAPAAVVTAQAPAPAPASTVSPELSAKLVPRPKTAPAPAPAPRRRGQNRRAAQLNAHLPDDNGPVKTFTWVRWKCGQEKRSPPILIGDDRALPGELRLEHLAELERMSVDARHATHFLVTKDGFLFFYGFVPGKGWHFLEDGSMQLRYDDQCNGGLFAIFPVVMAVEYLRRLANPTREVASA